MISLVGELRLSPLSLSLLKRKKCFVIKSTDPPHRFSVYCLDPSYFNKLYQHISNRELLLYKNVIHN